MPRGATINRAATRSRMVLRHMRRHLQIAALFHEVPPVRCKAIDVVILREEPTPAAEVVPAIPAGLQRIVHRGFSELQQAAVDLHDPERIGAANAVLAAFRKSGFRKAMQVSIDADIARSGRKYLPPYFIATKYSTIGDKERTFQWLERAYQAHDDYLPYLKIEPELESIHSDPRYADLLRRMGLPQ
jgi:hypothetical protein